MGMFKEEAKFLEFLAKKQQRIWGSSCDMGILKSDMSLRTVNQLRHTIKTLLELPGSKLAWRADQPAIQRDYRLVIMWGASDQVSYDATIYKVLYFKDRTKEFFSFDLKHARVDQDGKELY